MTTTIRCSTIDRAASAETACASSQATVSANLSYSIGVGGSATPRAVQEGGRGGDRTAPVAGRYRLVFMAAVNNLTNRTNFAGFSGIQTSPFFLTPTAAQNPRKVDIGVGLRF